MRLLIATMAVLGLAYVFVTPPMRVPDEHLHFFRSAAIANGHLVPTGGGKADSAPIPQGLKTLVWVMSWVDSSGKFTRGQFQTAIRIPLEPIKQPVVDFPAWYTPVPYLPQAFAVVVGRMFNIRPLIIFYAGRIANLAVAIVLIALAMRLAPSYQNIIAATALLPMAPFELASWSADALTLAVAILFIAIMVEGGGTAALIVFAFVLGLCKPAYFLLAVLVFAIPGRRLQAKFAVVASMAVATIVSFGYARAASFQQRTGLPIDPAAQLQCVIHDPLRFARALLADVAIHGRYYLEGTVGRFGLNELPLPTIIVILEVVTLIAAAMTSQRVLNPVGRLVAILIFIVTAAGIVLSQYMVWSIVCGDTIEGVQGRYFLPIVPLALLAIGWNRWRFDPRVLAVVALVCNAFAFAAIVRRYWI
ncbi:MAG TPA: DUF2142 domain-containing protein [Thermoanaerobaculia bacterium]|nr:DUF2142 domain-containing protein [Thermoanaerobaculia bacterium]